MTNWKREFHTINQTEQYHFPKAEQLSLFSRQCTDNTSLYQILATSKPVSHFNISGFYSLSLCISVFLASLRHQMVKEMRSEYSSSNPFSSPSSFHKHNHVFVKFAVSLLLVGSAFRLFFSDSIRYISVLEPLPPPVETEQELKETETPVSSFLAQTPSSLPPIDFPATNITQESENGKQHFLSLIHWYMHECGNENYIK